MKSSEPPIEGLLLPPRRPVARKGRVAFGLLLRLAWQDLWHERILTLCVIVALTAVLAPLLILLSLKYGLVETLRARLVTDPRNREIRPQTSEVFTLADIESLRQRPDVRFVMPLTRAISSSVQISLLEQANDRIDTEIVPTGDGDPLLEENGTHAPRMAECVLSGPLYHRLIGEGTLGQLRIHVARQSRSGTENASTDLAVIGRVSERATSRETVFVPLAFLEQIESWLEGNPVPALGWTGDSNGVSPVAEEIIVPTTRPLEAVEKAALLVNTGFSEMQELTRDDVGKLMPVPEGAVAFYQFATSAQRHDDPADASSITRFRSSLPPVAGDIYGYCRPLELRVSASGASVGRTALFHVQPEVVNRPARKAIPIITPPSAPVPPPTTETIKPPAPTAPPQQIPPQAVPPTPSPPAQTMPPATAPPGFKFDSKVAPLEHPPAAPPAMPVPKSDNKKKDEKKDEKTSDKDRKADKPADKSKAKTRRMGNESTARFSPDGGRYVMAAPPATPEVPTVRLPADWQFTAGQMVQLTFATPSGDVTFPAKVEAEAASTALIGQSIAGVLRVGMERPIEYQADLGSFVTTRRGWPSFRLIAKDIDSVQGLVDYFHARHMNVITRADRIRDVRELDRYTNHVFWIIAGVGLTGAVGALLASLIASVERKRRSLGVLRLLGLRRRSLVRMPFYQSTLVVSASVGLAIAAWWWVSRFIAQFTTRYLDVGEELAAMPPIYLALLWAGALIIAAAASFIAGIRVMKVDPSEAIRDE